MGAENQFADGISVSEHINAAQTSKGSRIFKRAYEALKLSIRVSQPKHIAIEDTSHSADLFMVNNIHKYGVQYIKTAREIS